MLSFLFLFRGAVVDATGVEPKDRDILIAFEEVRGLANL